MVLRVDLDLFIGTYPAVADGIVERQMCVRTAFSCCQDSFHVKAKNCSTFLTFKLKPVPKCNQRYCYGKYVDV